METQKLKTSVAGKEIIIESGQLAGLASGAVTARMGDTVILATAVVSEEPREGVDFFPLMVDYEERLYAAGKISGSRFIKREGRPSEQAILTCRLIDRPLRPLFPKNYRNDIQVIITTLSYDGENDPDILGIIAASSALMQTNAPFEGPVAGARVGLVDDKLIINPTRSQIKKSKLDIVVAATKEKIMMLEAGAHEVDEKTVVEAIKLAHKAMQPALKMQDDLTKNIKREKIAQEKEENKLHKEVKEYLGDKLAKAVKELDKEKRNHFLKQFEGEVLENFEGNYKQIELKSAFEILFQKEVRNAILKDNLRPDGRKLDEIRPINIQVGLLPRTHGSALFSRGQTQSLTIATLGGPGEEQIIDTMEEEGEKRYMHHYNFPPFSTGEVKPIRSTGRREVGHGALAERALIPVIPSKEDFPYTIRLVSEILSSNGSSSMAATCASTLALMDAGVPIKKPVAGMAIGLVTSEDYDQSTKSGKYKLLTDIQGLEDFGGDMDFKVTGTKDGITAIQLDIKLKGIDYEIIEGALERAKAARLKVLEMIAKIIPEPRKEMSIYAPRIYSHSVDKEKIGEIIGPAGKNIRAIIEDCGGKEITSIDIDDDGMVYISSTDAKMGEKALQIVKDMTKEAHVGEIYQGEVVNIQKDRMTGNEIGAIVQITPRLDGMVHISQIADYRVAKVSDVLHIGDKIPVMVLDVDKAKGRISLSYKAAKSSSFDQKRQHENKQRSH
jgi:polyribonucleotide nucleotidyltransferase